MKSRRKRVIEFPAIKAGVVVWVGIVALFISVVLITLFWRFPNERELLTFTATVLSSTATVISAVYIAQGLTQNVEFSKLTRAIELTERWNSPDFSETKAVTIELAKILSNLPVEERLKALNDALNSGNGKEAALVNTFNFFEEIAILTNKKLLDEEVLREFYQGIVITYYSLFELWINERRVKSQRGSAVYSNLEIMYHRWKNAA
jgi:hypothetical protein